jgi:cytoskeletal protein CcmA (bactofilin family)
MIQKNKTTMTTDPQEPARNRIGHTTKLKGDIISDGNFRIDGLLEGTIRTKGKVVVGPKGIVSGDVFCQNADIEGTIKGKITVDQLLTLNSTAKILGDIVVNRLSIEPGASFTGSCQMGAVIKDIKSVEKPQTNDQKEERSA